MAYLPRPLLHYAADCKPDPGARTRPVHISTVPAIVQVGAGYTLWPGFMRQEYTDLG